MPGMHIHDGEKFVPVGGGTANLDLTIVKGNSSISGYENAIVSVASPLVNSVHVSNAEYAFSGVSDIPNFTVDAGITSTRHMFNRAGLVNAPMFDTSNVTRMDSMFANCSRLLTVPEYDTSRVSDFQQTFYNCRELVEIPSMDMSQANTLANVANTGNVNVSSKLEKFGGFGFRVSLALWFCSLSADAINEVFENAGVALNSSQTINVKDNPGSATCDPSIATAKGWQVITA